MTICSARRNSTTITCAVDLGEGRFGCACRVAVEADIKAGETREARVPDSARVPVAPDEGNAA